MTLLKTSWAPCLLRISWILATNAHAEAADAYTANAYAAIQELNDAWYDVSTGVWDNTWWNSANMLTTIADFAALRLDEANQLNVGGYMQNTFVQAQKTTVQTTKAYSTTGMVSSKTCLNEDEGCKAKREFLGKRGYDDFLNYYYDDEGWWGLAWCRAYDISGNQDYLEAAVAIFNDMQTGLGGPCGGGIYWNKDRQYVNAIANELYLALAASLANRIPDNGTYLEIAKSQWEWFKGSGMINADNLINDGLDDNCQNNGAQTWSYNQGVVLGGLVELAVATGETHYIDKASILARSAIKALANDDMVLEEVDHCELEAGHCGGDGSQFKGVFLRNVHYLNNINPQDYFEKFILANADSIWNNDRNDQDMLGIAWQGPYIDATAATHSSALDALVAAIAVA